MLAITTGETTSSSASLDLGKQVPIRLLVPRAATNRGQHPHRARERAAPKAGPGRARRTP